MFDVRCMMFDVSDGNAARRRAGANRGVASVEGVEADWSLVFVKEGHGGGDCGSGKPVTNIGNLKGYCPTRGVEQVKRQNDVIKDFRVEQEFHG